MSEKPSYEPTPADLRKAEESLTPVQGAMTDSRYAIMSRAQDFKEVGVGPELVEAAAEKSANRAKEEFEAREKQDPINRIFEVLDNCAETPDEKKVVERIKSDLEKMRKKLKDAAMQEGVLNSDAIELAKALCRDHLVEESVFFDGEYETKQELDIHFEREHNEKEFMQRLLKGLGVLKNTGPVKTLEDLNNLPLADYSSLGSLRGPFRDLHRENPRNLETNIPGIKLDIDISSNRIWMNVDAGNIKKIVDHSIS